MPKIGWPNPSSQLRQHLFDRAVERKITTEDLFALEKLRRHSPGAVELPRDNGASWSMMNSAWQGMNVFGRAYPEIIDHNGYPRYQR